MKKALFLGLIAGIFAFASQAIAAAPALTARVDVTEQKMWVSDKAGKVIYTWPVSTGRWLNGTPTGKWRGRYTVLDHKSTQFLNGDMPFSIFYFGGFAIHGTKYEDKIGSPASAGCIRLHLANAKVLYTMVEEIGAENFEVIVEQGKGKKIPRADSYEWVSADR
jgi:lipoprotein-anchoring transpeptidase ErfK/SrfK